MISATDLDLKAGVVSIDGLKCETIKCPFDLDTIEEPITLLSYKECRIVEAFCNLPMVNPISAKDLRKAIQLYQNNYRKMHGLPMRRRYRKH